MAGPAGRPGIEGSLAAGETTPKLIDAWAEGKVDKAATAKHLEIVLQALVEHYDEYRDYNTTTTQSDYGENIHILLDMLRLKVRYDRFAWRMRPLAVIMWLRKIPSCRAPIR